MTVKESITAMVTPMRNGSTDGEAVRKLVKRLTQGGVNEVFILGTDGEFHVLSREERVKLATAVTEYADYRVPAYVGSGGNSVQEVVELSQALQQTSITVLSIITPFPVPLGQQELLQHYEAVADVANIPIILYNIPKNTGNSIEPQTVATLACHDNIVGIKGSSGNTEQIKRRMELTGGMEFTVLSGSDSLILKVLKLGTKGAVAVTSNLLTDVDVAIIRYSEQGKLAEAQMMQEEIEPLRKMSRLGNIPSMLKATMNMARITAGGCREPVIMPNEAVLAKVREMLQYYVQEGEM